MNTIGSKNLKKSKRQAGFTWFVLFFVSLFTIHSASFVFGANIGRATYGLISETYPGFKDQVYNERDSVSPYDYLTGADPDGGYVGIWPSTDNIQLSSDTVDFREGGSSLKAVVNGSAGWFIQFGTPTVSYADMSDYTDGTIDFWVKTSTDLRMEIKEVNLAGPNEMIFQKYLRKDTLDVNGDPLEYDIWQRFSIPFTEFTYGIGDATYFINAVQIPIQFVPTASATFYIDGLVWRKGGADPGSYEVGLKNRSDDTDALSILWSGIDVGVTEWKLADQYVELDLTLFDPDFGVQVYTDNLAADADPQYTGSSDPAGLVAEDRPSINPLPMAWHITGSTVSSLTVMRGVESGVCDGNSYPDRLWTTENGPCYPAFLWMKDQNSDGFINGDDYVTVWETVRGIQHGESTWGGAAFPNMLYIAADFSNAKTPRTYQVGKLVVELFYE